MELVQDAWTTVGGGNCVQNPKHDKKYIIRIKQLQNKISKVSLANEKETLHFGDVRILCFYGQQETCWDGHLIFNS